MVLRTKDEWTTFITAAGIPPDESANCATAFVNNRLTESLYCTVLYCITFFYVGNNLYLHQITSIYSSRAIELIETESNR